MKAALFTLALSLCLLAAVSAAAGGDRPSGGGDGGAGGQTGGDGGQTGGDGGQARGDGQKGMYDSVIEISIYTRSELLYFVKTNTLLIAMFVSCQ